VPSWHAAARWRFEAGLANDLIGYLIPAWGFSSEQGTYLSTCSNDSNNRDPKGHQHKLEDESVGPTAGNLVADHLSALLDATQAAGVSVQRGRFVRPDGSLSRSPVGAVGAQLADGRLLALKGTSSLGGRPVTGAISFIDYDGASQSGADITTRGVRTGDGKRIFLDVYPTWP
jgi:hypothetical protein